MPSIDWTAQCISYQFQQISYRAIAQKILRRGKRTVPSHVLARGFLNLPTEIRLLIYEAIFTPASVVLQSGDNPAMIAVPRNFPELISRGSRDVQLFRTCRTCCHEAVPIFYGSLNLWVYQQLPLLRFNFLPHIGPFNASFIRRVTITPIGLPGEHQRLLECLGARHGGLVGIEDLTLEIWDLDQVAALVRTCQELMQRHEKLKILLGRGVVPEAQVLVGDIPATLKLTKPGQTPGHREQIMQSGPVVDSREPPDHVLEECSGEGPRTSACRRRVSLAVPEPKRTIWSRYKLRRARKS